MYRHAQSLPTPVTPTLTHPLHRPLSRPPVRCLLEEHSSSTTSVEEVWSRFSQIIPVDLSDKTSNETNPRAVREAEPNGTVGSKRRENQHLHKFSHEVVIVQIDIAGPIPILSLSTKNIKPRLLIIYKIKDMCCFAPVAPVIKKVGFVHMKTQRTSTNIYKLTALLQNKTYWLARVHTIISMSMSLKRRL